MSLPDLAWQIAYGRVAWGIVLAAVLLALWPHTRRLPRAVFGALLAAIAVAMALPGEASPAYWMGLAFQYPSGMLLGLCLLALHARWQGAQAGAKVDSSMPLAAAVTIAVAGLALYLDAIGWLSQGYYYAGFGPVLAPAVALVATLGCVLALVRGRGGRHNLALLGALLLFTLLRLPTGNLWDAVLDPLLWGWALATLAGRALRPVAGRRIAGRRIAGVSRLRPVPIEQFSTSKE